MSQESVSYGNSSTVPYQDEYFNEFKPVALRDMLRSVPGTVVLLAQVDKELAGRRVRGFGSSGDQIFLNGSIKYNAIRDHIAKSGWDRLRYTGNISLNNAAFNEIRGASQAHISKL